MRNLARIDNNGTLWLHQSLLGESDNMILDDGWYNTGDVVESMGEGKFKFKARANSFINVGGDKVNPEEIEEAILATPGICEVRVYGVPNSVTGSLVVADIVLDPSVGSPDQVISSLKQRLRVELQANMIPRIFNVKNTISVTTTGKKTRQ